MAVLAAAVAVPVMALASPAESAPPAPTAPAAGPIALAGPDPVAGEPDPVRPGGVFCVRATAELGVAEQVYTLAKANYEAAVRDRWTGARLRPYERAYYDAWIRFNNAQANLAPCVSAMTRCQAARLELDRLTLNATLQGLLEGLAKAEYDEAKAANADPAVLARLEAAWKAATATREATQTAVTTQAAKVDACTTPLESAPAPRPVPEPQPQLPGSVVE